MTREEALQILDTIPTIGEQVDALEMAISALEQEPCDDAISRILKKMWNCRGKHTTSIDKVAMEQIIRDELSVTQKPIECDDAISRDAVKELIKSGVSTDTYDDVEQVCKWIDEIPSVTQKSGKWIPVSERLPKENETVLINYCRLNERSVRMAIWDELHCRFYNSEYTKYVSVDFVTAWMPLPEPFEPQESEDKGWHIKKQRR